MKPQRHTKTIFFKRRNIWLFATVLLSLTVLIFANYYTLKVSNSIRAYVQGESEYSKGQKNGCLNLILYVQTGDTTYYEYYKDNIIIPHYNGLALHELLKSEEKNEETIREYFLEGGNHPDDIDNLIWLFRTFRNVHFMENAINIWAESNHEIESLLLLGREVHQAKEEVTADSLQDQKFIAKIERFASAINKKEGRFSDVMGQTARQIRDYLFWVNVLICAIIFALLGVIYNLVISDMKRFQNELKEKNQHLTESNTKLDHLIYATSHDLKAPVNNIQGLINIATMDSGGLNDFHKNVLDKIHTSMDSVTGTIEDIEHLMRLDNEPFDDFEKINIEEMLNLILIESEIEKDTRDIEIRRDLHTKYIYFSKVGMRSILQNLITNAIKYRSHNRKLELRIESELVGEMIHIRVKDNGLGIDLTKFGDVLFDMFSRFHQNIPGSGLGLYAVRRIVERNDGKILVESEPGKGSTFTVELKKSQH